MANFVTDVGATTLVSKIKDAIKTVQSQVDTNTSDISTLKTANNNFSLRLLDLESKATTVKRTLTTSWSKDSDNGYYYQNVTSFGITSSDTPILDVQTSGTLENIQAQQTEWAKVVQATTYTNGIKFYATEATTMELIILVRR